MSSIPVGYVSETGTASITQIEAAVKFAEESPFPDVRETYTDVYVNY